MYCAQPLSYTIRQGDTLDRLAGEYRTTVPMIVAHNLNIDPENLRVGSTLVICPGKGLAEAPGGPKPPEALNASRAFLLSNNMREAWEQHVYWTRLLLISIAERLKDQTDTANRVLQNPGDIAALFACCYPPEITR
ncbi:MAG: LysM peptidoglycan-binding domain-containing protein, partial [Oscillospiraceae bacterium]|nr:LysM peptidoglycan-binding domain-containing protein [Oscillospiraceae bacterium]